MTDHSDDCAEPHRIEQLRKQLEPLTDGERGFRAIAIVAVYECSAGLAHSAFFAGINPKHVKPDDLIALMDGMRGQADAVERKLRDEGRPK